jgi:hypothetical protein
MLASDSVASTVGAMVSAWGRGADSSAAGVESSSAAAALGSSPSQDNSVDFLHSTQSVVNKYDYQSTGTTRERSSLTSSIGQQSRSGR